MEKRDTVFKPRLHRLLRQLRLDVTYERGAGPFLYHLDRDGREIETLDLAGGYGALLFGHNHPELVAEATRMLASGRPFLAQGSRRRYAVRLAETLAERLGGCYRVLLASSGAEAVEAALKHALLQTGGSTFVVMEGGFHGKSLAALTLAGPMHRHETWNGCGVAAVRVPPNDLEALEDAFARTQSPAGFLFEPILGEGGVVPIEAEFARRAAALCRARGIPLIADECQTGLGRAGRFLACETLGVEPDYVMLSKSLGGGLAKVAALLVHRKHYDEAFDFHHTSTFAEDDFGCAVACRAVAMLDEAFLDRCRSDGAGWERILRGVAAAFPDVVAAVRGRGLMWGLALRGADDSSSFMMRQLSRHERLGLAAAGYLLHAHRVRVLPTLSQPMTLRVQPCEGIAEAERVRAGAALWELCRCIRDGAAAALLSHLGSERETDEAPPEEALIPTEQASRDNVYAPRLARLVAPGGRRRTAWLCHLVDERDLTSLEPGLAALDSLERERLLASLAPLGEPALMSVAAIRSATGEEIEFLTIMIPVTSRWFKARLRGPSSALPRALVGSALEFAARLGCEVAALGQYTSIVTGNGLRAGGSMGLSTGNNLAVALALESVAMALERRGLAPGAAHLAVVGANGNIGRACAEQLAPKFRRTLLAGSDRASAASRLAKLCRSLPRASAVAALEEIREAHAVIVATNAVEPVLRAEHFRREAVVCDLSVPAGVDPEVSRLRPDLHYCSGGLARLPGSEDLGIPGFPLSRGLVYACMAEGMLLGWEGERGRYWTGAVTAAKVGRMRALARRHGIALAEQDNGAALRQWAIDARD